MEILVVIVVFAVGILAVMQIFPSGLRIMSDQRDRSVAQQLSKSALQREDGRTEGFPEQILPVSLVNASGVVNVVPNYSQRPDPTGVGVQGITIDQDGLVTNASGAIGNWELVTGANIFRRIVNEGHRIPAPRQVGSSYFGGLLLLNYGPCLTNTPEHASGLTYNPAFDVIGSDMVRKDGVPNEAATTLDYVYYIDKDDATDATLYLPRTAAASGSPRTYEIRLSGTVRLQSSAVVHEDLTFNAVVDSDPSGGYYEYILKNEPTFTAALNTGDSLLSLDKESVRVARQFTKLANSAAFSTSDPYQYKLLNWNLGMLLFNPAGYSVVEERPQGRVPLKARVSYDVYDWRILKDDVRIPDYSSQGGQISLPVRNLRVLNNLGADGKTFAGMNIPVPDYDAVNTTVIDNYQRDFAILDTETGAAYLPSAYSVDYSRGVVTFKGANSQVLYPGDTTVSVIPSTGRSVRVLCMAEGDWAVQLQKPSSDYRAAYDTPKIGEYFIGGTKAGAPSFGAATRIYFPWADLGHAVRIDRIAYNSPAGKQSITGQSFQISSTNADSVGPFIDITTVDETATGIDLSDGLGVQGVHGASVSVRTLWNRAGFTLGPDTAANANAVDSYRQGFKSVRLTTSFMGGEAQ